MAAEAGALPGWVEINNFFEATQLCPTSPASASKLTITPSPASTDPIKVKAADVNNDGKTELIITDKNMRTFSMYDASGRYIKQILNPYTDTFDFAVIDWDGDGASNLVILRYTPAQEIWIMYNINSYSDYSSLSTYQYRIIPPDPAYDFNLLKALYVDGRPGLAIMHTGEGGNGGVVVYKAPAFVIDPPIRVYYATFDIPSCRRIRDFDFVDWNRDGIRKELVILAKGTGDIGCTPAHNDLWIYDITKMGNTGAVIGLARANDPTLSYTWIDAKDDDAEEMYVEDFDNDGKDEIITMDTGDANNARAYSNNCGNSIGTEITDALLGTCLERTDDITVVCATDMAAVAVLYGYGPKIG